MSEAIEQASEFDALAVAADQLEGVAAPVTPPPQKPAAPPTEEIIYPVLSLAFDAIAPAWAVSEQEMRALAAAYGELLDKYFPDMSFGVELNALIITAAFLGPRMKLPRSIEHKAPSIDGEAR